MSTTPKGPADDLPVIEFEDDTAFERWLLEQRDVKGVWLKIAKKGQGVVTVNYQQALDVALCHGWIDGHKRGLDETYFLQRFSPRRPKGLWSKINIGKVEQLIAAG
ncbi:MAG: YdeI/OmpD-associated family protein, partial [Lysobacter sp.]